MLCAKSTTCSAQLPEYLTVRNSRKQKQTIAKVAGLCTPFKLTPTNFTTYIWNRTNDPCCPFCFGHTESIAHLFNGCKEFHNFYGRRHDRIVGKLFDEIKLISCLGKKVYTNKLLETLLPEYREELTLLQHRKPDIVIIDETS